MRTSTRSLKKEYTKEIKRLNDIIILKDYDIMKHEETILQKNRHIDMLNSRIKELEKKLYDADKAYYQFAHR